nr:glutamate receptor 1.1 [Quercus suber]
MMANELIPVGVVLDLKSPVGRVAERYMAMVLSDFYAVNHNYSTRLSLLAKDSGNDVIAAASAAPPFNHMFDVLPYGAYGL